jgi:hypothetical protein
MRRGREGGGVCNSSVRGLFVCEEEDFLASGGEQRGFLLLPQGRKASQWRDCDYFTRRLLLQQRHREQLAVFFGSFSHSRGDLLF